MPNIRYRVDSTLRSWAVTPIPISVAISNSRMPKAITRRVLTLMFANAMAYYARAAAVKICLPMAAHAHLESGPARRLRGNEWRSVRVLLPYLMEFRGRVILALSFLIAAKLANVSVPLVMKSLVDDLDPKLAMVAVPAALLAAYGLLRFSTTLFGELRDVVFVRVTQHAIRRVALGVFRHLHALSLRFHLERQTGGMTRDIERGTRGISTLLSYLLFSIIPVILEFALVAAVLLGKFDWRFAAVTFGAVAGYIGFTTGGAQWGIQIPR